MGRYRGVGPEVFRDPSLAGVSIEARWTFVGMWCFADDGGRLEDDPRMITANVYPRDAGVTALEVTRRLDELADAGLICRYQVDGDRLLHVPGFRLDGSPWQQRIARSHVSALPLCPRCESGGDLDAELREMTDQ
jgi:hypothetical protein